MALTGIYPTTLTNLYADPNFKTTAQAMTFTVVPAFTEPTTEVPAKTPKEALLHAARYIEEHGWTQKAPKDADGGVCLGQALHEVSSGRVRAQAAKRLSDQLYRVGDFPMDNIIHWNDSICTSAAEAVAALRWAAR